MSTGRPHKTRSNSPARAPRKAIKPQPAGSRELSTKYGEPFAGVAPESPSLVVFGDSANAAAVERRPPRRRHDVPPRGPPGGRWVQAKATALFAVVTAVGIAEVELLGLPGWVNLLYVIAGAAVAVDWLHQIRRRGQADARRWLDTRTLPALPAPADEPPVVDESPVVDENVAQHGAAPNDSAENECSATDADEPSEIEPSATRVADNDGAARDAHPKPQRGRALGYTTVSSGDHGEQLALDARNVRAWCEQRGVTVVKMVHDVEDTGERDSGPALAWALDRIAGGEVDTLIVPRLRCLAPTVASLPQLLRWFTEPERRLVAIDLQLNTATDAGRLAANALAGVGTWENERLSVRTRRGLEAARTRGAGRARAAVADVPELRERVMRMREQGKTLQAIADTLNEEGVPTLRGGAKWRPSSVQRAAGYRRPARAHGISVPATPDGAGFRQPPTSPEHAGRRAAGPRRPDRD